MGVINDLQAWVRASRALPQATPDGVQTLSRGGKYGEMYVQAIIPTKHSLADEGSYFSLTNPTLGTAVTYALTTAFSDTAGLFLIQNVAPLSDTTRIYLDFARLILMGTAPTATVSMHFAVKLSDPGTTRIPTANSRNDLGVNCNMDNARASVARVYQFAAGSMTLPAAPGGARTVARASLPTSLGIAGDDYVLQFGGIDHAPYAGLTAARATAPAKLCANVAPVVIGPGQYAVIYMWWLTAATTAPSFEYELGWYER